MKCPYTYADGHKCSGEIWQARAYGRNHSGIVKQSDVKKIRLRCSEKDDHTGAVSSFVTKDRMEFYPDELQKLGLLEEAIALCDNVERTA
jgi:hypothetical protein